MHSDEGHALSLGRSCMKGWDRTAVKTVTYFRGEKVQMLGGIVVCLPRIGSS